MNKSKKKALLINEGLSDNFGDQIIRESMTYILEKYDYEVVFCDLTRNKKEYNYLYNSEQKIKQKTFLTPLKSLIWKLLWTIRNLKRVLLASIVKYDIVVIGGGQLLISNGIFPFALFSWVTFLKIRNNRKIVLFGVGMQGKYKGIPKLMILYVLQNISSIYVRDILTINILKKTFNKSSKLTYDVAFIYDKIYQPVLMPNKVKYKYLIGVVDYDVYVKYNQKSITKQQTREEYFFTWIQKLVSVVDLKDAALIYSTSEDRNECLQFKSYIKAQFGIEIELLENHTKQDYLLNLQNGTIVISGRMHSLILSLVLKRKIIPYIISEKIQNFYPIVKECIEIERIQKSIFDHFEDALLKIN